MGSIVVFRESLRFRDSLFTLGKVLRRELRGKTWEVLSTKVVMPDSGAEGAKP
jgi:hypothetical protein